MADHILVHKMEIFLGGLRILCITSMHSGSFKPNSKQAHMTLQIQVNDLNSHQPSSVCPPLSLSVFIDI